MISVCLCTRNRANSLARTLDALKACRPPSQAWELVIVDNGSTDATPTIIARYQDQLPVRAVTEPKRGVSNARNAGVRAARGEYLIWTDDDVIPCPDWLILYEAAFLRSPDIDLFGGRIVPVLQEPAPAWFRDTAPLLFMPLAARDFGPEPVDFDPAVERIPYGANFAVRAAVLQRFPFDPIYGPGGPYSGDETTVFCAMIAAGHRGLSVPGADVEHMIPLERQTEAYVAAWFIVLGRTMAYKTLPSSAPIFLGVPRWLWRARVQTECAFRWARLMAPPRVWVPRLIALSLARGQFQYYRAPPQA